MLNKKIFNFLIKIGLSEQMSTIMARERYGKEKDEFNFIINTMKDQQSQINELIKKLKLLNTDENILNNILSIGVKKHIEIIELYENILIR